MTGSVVAVRGHTAPHGGDEDSHGATVATAEMKGVTRHAEREARNAERSGSHGATALTAQQQAAPPPQAHQSSPAVPDGPGPLT